MGLVDVIASVLGVCGALIGISGWFAGAIRKSYAAEREFLHIKSLINQGYQDIDKQVSILIDRVEKIEDLMQEMVVNQRRSNNNH